MTNRYVLMICAIKFQFGFLCSLLKTDPPFTPGFQLILRNYTMLAWQARDQNSRKRTTSWRDRSSRLHSGLLLF
jgi:hypothetical protein